VPADNRDLNYDKYFIDGNGRRSSFSEFNSNNTTLLTVKQIKQKLLGVKYIQQELKAWGNR
jgi:UDP-N-acetylglucosamine 4,6-dehydratase